MLRVFFQKYIGRNGTFDKEVMFSPVSVCPLIVQQDYTKSTELICTKLGTGIAHRPDKSIS